MSKTKSVLLLIALVGISACAALAASVDGDWIAKVEGREGRSLEFTFHFQADGDKLSGHIAAMGGQQEISDGSIQGDTIVFKVKREMQGRAITMRYEGKLAGDEIKFKQTIEGADRPPREFTAKRAK